MKMLNIYLCFSLLLCFAFQSIGQKYANMASHSTTVVLNGINDVRKKIFEQNTKYFLDAVNNAYRNNSSPKIPNSIADEQVNEVVNNHWAVSPFLSVRTEVIENILNTGNGNFEVRNIQIVLEEAADDYKQQDAVIIFNDKGKIIDFKIALSYHSISNTLRNSSSVTDLRRRHMIISFVEDFRTAYNLKDVNYLEKVFSDKALIITGKVIEKSVEGELRPIVEYTKQTKAQYLHNLETIFAKSKLLNINFDSINLVVHPKNQDIYGVNLFQTWNTESIKGGKYQDAGYIFLIIDFADEQKPMIWVRTWALENLFSMNSFTIN